MKIANDKNVIHSIATNRKILYTFQKTIDIIHYSVVSGNKYKEIYFAFKNSSPSKNCFKTVTFKQNTMIFAYCID